MNLNIHFSSPVQNIQVSKLEGFKKIISNPKTQFFNTFLRNELVESSKNTFNKFKHKKIFVHVGIGGSSLGPEMIVMALKKSDVKFIFINNIDPEEIHDQFQDVNLNDCLFYFVSKSGGTAETLAALSIISQKLYSIGIASIDLKNHVVFATDSVKSELLELGKNLNIDCLEVPSDVGGRFCALTPVGYLPALFAGIDIDKLVLGAKKAQEICLENTDKNLMLKTCEFLFQLKKEKNISQTVFMPYSSKLKYFSFWFTQLWAESLGKKHNLKKETVFTGFTPITAYGATDQHSQVQLFMEGPKDKALILIEVLNFKNDFKLNGTLSSKGLDKLSGFSMANLMKAELHGTLKALKENDRPFIHLTIDQNDEEHLGALIVFFESLTALMGDYLEIDPFDQPGVELGKIYAFEFLSLLK
jgi:glucose-6-phosphate isomerase